MTTEASTDTKTDAPEETPQADPSRFITSIGVMLAILGAVELCYRDSSIDVQIRKGGGHLSAKAIEYATMPADIVTTGNSVMFHALKPQVIEDTLAQLKGRKITTYNYGVPSAGPPMWLTVANEAVHHKPPPKLFIIGVTPILSVCCGDIYEGGGPLGLTATAIPAFVRAAWWSSPEDAGAAVFLGSSRLLSARAEVLYATREIKMWTPYVFHDRGYWSLGGPVSPEAQEIRARGRATSYADAMDKSKGAPGRIHPTGPRYLAETIRILQRAGTKVVLLGVPQARQLDWYHDDKHTYPEYLAEMADLCQRFGIEFVDLYNPPGIQNVHFVDGDHMTDAGATIFSKLLAETVIARYFP